LVFERSLKTVAKLMDLHSEMRLTFSVWLGICTLDSSDFSTSHLSFAIGIFLSEFSFAYSGLSLDYWVFGGGC